MPAAIIIGSEKSSPSAQEVDIPSAAVAIDGTNPEPGDEIEFTCKAKVKQVNGSNASVTITEVNGTPVDSKAESEEPSNDDDMMDIADKADRAQEE
jgi:hypothetical protein